MLVALTICRVYLVNGRMVVGRGASNRPFRPGEERRFGNAGILGCGGARRSAGRRRAVRHRRGVTIVIAAVNRRR
jgi:hypothetical protein